jgi:DNA-binding transcriptional ArsR family regulator
MSEFEPQPMLVIETPEQIKCFTDALRIRVLRILRERAATNQQIADELGEPHAKVLYHVRFLLDAGLARLVEQRISGGNVEKYYRAVARVFDLRPAQPDTETDIALIHSLVDMLRSDMITSTILHPEQPIHIHQLKGWMTPARAAEFNERLLALAREYFSAHDRPTDAAAGDLLMRLGVFLFRAPEGLTPTDENS